MKYTYVCEGKFIKRPNRFIAHVEIDGKEEVVHVKNTGRCGELFLPGATVFLQESDQKDRKTKWDLIAVEKEGKKKRLINIDSQAPNQVVKEWLQEGNLIGEGACLRPEYTYGSSRIDFYAVQGEHKMLIEVKGVSLEEDGVVSFPDAPSERAVRHLKELMQAVKDGYEAYVLFVVQMEEADYFIPNEKNHPEFAKTLLEAQRSGVHVLAYECQVEPDFMKIHKEVPVILEPEEIAARKNYEIVKELPQELLSWYRGNKRDLPWRRTKDPYHIWVSEIMLQQTRVEAVKPYYERFLRELPEVKDLAEAKEDQLLKLWEGLGYYNRVRNMQKAANQIMVDYEGRFPEDFSSILSLQGIGNYTAGAIGSIAFGIPKPAVDGNVLRVISRITGSEEDIMKQSVRNRMEAMLEQIIPEDAAGDFNQALIELGAIVCVPNGTPLCEECPAKGVCVAHRQGRELELPVKKKTAARRVEKRTVLLFRDGETCAIRKRPGKGLLAGMYEFPNLEGHLSKDEVIAYSKKIGLSPIRVKKAGTAKHIFSHVEWHMTGYHILVDELEKSNDEQMIFAQFGEIEKRYPIPAAFEKYKEQVILV